MSISSTPHRHGPRPIGGGLASAGGRQRPLGGSPSLAPVGAARLRWASPRPRFCLCVSRPGAGSLPLRLTFMLFVRRTAVHVGYRPDPGCGLARATLRYRAFASRLAGSVILVTSGGRWHHRRLFSCGSSWGCCSPTASRGFRVTRDLPPTPTPAPPLERRTLSAALPLVIRLSAGCAAAPSRPSSRLRPVPTGYFVLRRKVRRSCSPVSVNRAARTWSLSARRRVVPARSQLCVPPCAATSSPAVGSACHGTSPVSCCPTSRHVTAHRQRREARTTPAAFFELAQAHSVVAQCSP